MPLFDVPVKITTTSSVRFEAESLETARDMAESCIDVIDAEFVFDVGDVEMHTGSVSILEIAGEPTAVESDE